MTNLKTTALIAEEELAKHLSSTSNGTQYIAGFRTKRGRELALERNRDSVFVWVECIESGLPGITIRNVKNPGMPYSKDQGRNSNLNATNAPRLMRGKPAFYLEVAGVEDLKELIRWYQAA
jgi:hypothetical protein